MAEESGSERWGRRLRHFAAHPIAWLRYLWVRELRGREVLFEQNPRFRFWRPMYRASRSQLARILDLSPSVLDGYFEELTPLHDQLVANVGPLPSAGALIQGPLVYLLVRARRPAWMIETGISSGYSARLILEAMRKNRTGHLDSIGIDLFALKDPSRPDASGLGGRRVGWLVPPEFQDLWGLHLGLSTDLLPPLLATRPEPLDIFLHDSLHQLDTMRWEYATAAARLAPDGLLLSHDIHANEAWPMFVAEPRVARWEELDHDLGVARVAGVASGTSPR